MENLFGSYIDFIFFIVWFESKMIFVFVNFFQNLIDEIAVEHWFLSYIELLHRLHLWNAATEVIQHASKLPLMGRS